MIGLSVHYDRFGLQSCAWSGPNQKIYANHSLDDCLLIGYSLPYFYYIMSLIWLHLHSANFVSWSQVHFEKNCKSQDPSVCKSNQGAGTRRISFPLHSNHCHSPPPKTWIRACVHITQETSKEAMWAHLSISASLALQTPPRPTKANWYLSLSLSLLRTSPRPTKAGWQLSTCEVLGESLTPGWKRRPDTWELQQLGLVCLYLWLGSFWA